MKILQASLVGCAVAMLSGVAFAGSGSLVSFKSRVMPVVVDVDATGQVTGIMPSGRLRPAARSLLVRQLSRWITGPAIVKGKPVPSTFIVEVGVQSRELKNGDYKVNYAYVKSMPVPFYGLAYWSHSYGHSGPQLTLVDAGMAGSIGQALDGNLPVMAPAGRMVTADYMHGTMASPQSTGRR
ncbi:MAG TPA: hypothetical protein VF292_12265 [Rhodanobacteraceae bacterium]